MGELKKIPFILVYSRIILAVIIGLVALSGPAYKELIIALLMTLGLLTDLFDGIIARKYNVATEKLRVWDSNVDVFFWLVVLASVFYLDHEFLLEHLLYIAGLIALEITAYVISYCRFRKTVATHSYLAKIWTLSLLVFLIDLLMTGDAAITFVICIVLGYVSRSEIILIIILLKRWTTDVSSLMAVRRINNDLAENKTR